jgi:cytochrome oxidase assembly protein ShyY1
MYRFLLRPRWLAFHALCLLGIVVMVNLAFWQLRRLDERQEFNAEVTERSAAPVQRLADVLPPDGGPELADELDALEWYAVRASGTYTDGQVVVINRSQGGQAGLNVVTPLRLDDGRLLLVNRGFVPLTADVPAAPAGTVVVEGRLRTSQERRFGQVSDPADGVLTEVRRIDVARLARQLDAEVVPLYLDLATSQPPEGALPIPVPEPDLSEGPHLSYAVQWFIFSAAVAVGWVLAVRWSVRKRSAAATRS